MKWTQSAWCAYGVGFVFALAMLATPKVHAANIDINFSGMDIVYDGSTIYDAGSSSGGTGDPADADPLVNVNFVSDGGLVGSVSSDVAVDIFIPDVTGIPSSPNAHHVLTTPGNPGYFHLLIGTSPAAAEFLMLDLDEVTINYLDSAGMVQFTFGAAVASGSSQNLPFGLMAGEPISVSFSAQIDQGSLTAAGGVVTGFTASGTGEINAVPEPSTIGLAVLALAGAGLVWRRRS